MKGFLKGTWKRGSKGTKSSFFILRCVAGRAGGAEVSLRGQHHWEKRSVKM